MPIYDFACLTCGHSFDKLVRSSAAVDGVTCPDCQSGDVKKKLSLFASRSSGSSSSNPSANAAACSPGGL